MANPSLQIGDSNWAIKEDNLLGYSKAGTRFVPQPITMTRASAGTRVNPEGLVETVELLGSELVTNGDFATDSDWSVGSGGVITNGELVFASQNTSGTFQTISHQVGKTYKVSVEIKSVSNGSVRLDLAGGGATTQDFDTVGVHTGYVTPIQGGSFFIKTTAFQGSIDNISVKESTKNNLARVDYTDGTSSLLAEPQRTNLVTYSIPDNTNWSKGSNTTITENFSTSPDGTQNASRLVMPTGSETYAYYQFTATSTANHTFSFYAKNNGGDADVNMKFFIASQQQSITLTNEWKRFEFTTSITSGNAVAVGVDNLTSIDMLIWGCQCEESYATSYIPTSGSTVTRNQETYTKTGISDLINSEEGVLFLEASTFENGADCRITLSDGTITNRVSIEWDILANTIKGFVGSNGNLVSPATYNQTNSNKIAIKYKENDCALWINGTEVDTDSTVSALSGTNQLEFSNYNALLPFEGKVKQLQIFKTALTDSELAALTT